MNTLSDNHPINDAITNDNTSSIILFCPPFNTDEELTTYLTSISPSRNLICPITQSLFIQPIIAEDGHTYEKSALYTWFVTLNNNRSPVTNALLERASSSSSSSTNSEGEEHNLGICNLAISSMANIHRERLGKMLLEICVGVRDRELEEVVVVDYEGRNKRRRRLWSEEGVRVRIEGLLDAGADVNCGGDGGNTPLHLVSCVLCMLCTRKEYTDSQSLS